MGTRGRPAALYTYQNVTHTLREWAALRGLNYTTLHSRLHTFHVPLAEALTCPLTPRQDRWRKRTCLPKRRRDKRDHWLQWCPVHQQACLLNDAGRLEWHPLSQATINMAQALAVAADCARHIKIQTVPCPQCLTQKEAA